MSKYFTWSKGDRRPSQDMMRSSGILQVASEQGYEGTKGTKRKSSRRPLPLSFGPDTTQSSNFASRTNDSVLLHDAAVQSATNLMAVVNDMLCSPPISAHIMTQQRNGLAAPAYLRPRSHTAPPTPLVEAPTKEPVELPGSILLGRPSLVSLKPSQERILPTVKQQPSSAAVGAAIERPHSSPQQATYGSPSLLAHFEERPAQRTHATTSQSLPLLLPATPRPHLNDAATWSAYLSSRNDSKQTIDPEPKFATPAAASRVESQPHRICDARSSGTDPFRQITSIRTAHNNHLESLRTAHEHEIDSYRSYISFLEDHRQCTHHPTPPNKALTIDTAHADSKTGDALSAVTSATTLVSLQSTRSHDQVSGQSYAENQALKEGIAVNNGRPVSAESARSELLRLQESVAKRDRKISLLSRKWKDQEKSLRNTISDLESRLVAANNERLDTLEGLHLAGEQVRRLSEQKAQITEEKSGLQNQPAQQRPDFYPSPFGDKELTQRPNHQRTRSDVAATQSASFVLEQRNRDLQRQLSKAEAHIRNLEQQQNASARVGTKDSVTTTVTSLNAAETIAGLEIALNDHKQMLAVSRADCERYNELLHAELKRQRQRASRGTPRMPGSRQMSDDVLGVPKGSDQATTPLPPTQETQTPSNLELDYCMKQLVAHKLDIQGYRKALKQANARIQEMEMSSTGLVQRPPTPDRDSVSSSASSRSSGRAQQNATPGILTPESIPNNTSGLGISLRPAPETPLRTVASATTAALLATTPPLPSVSPTARPKTPMSVHKKLPKPPPVGRTPSPLPSQGHAVSQLQRGETLRSLSDSIISSYAKRMTPEQSSGFESQSGSTKF